MCCPGKEAGDISRLQKGLNKFGQQAHKQVVKGIGKAVVSSIPHPALVGAMSRREYSAEDGLRFSPGLTCSEAEGIARGDPGQTLPSTFLLLMP